MKTHKISLKGGQPSITDIGTTFFYKDTTNPKNNIKIDLKPLLDRFDVFAWDFDDTLMHIPNSQNKLGRMTINKINAIDDDYFYNTYFMNNATHFIELVLFLKKHKKTVAIISFGFRRSVEAALTKIFRHYYITNGILQNKSVLPFYINELRPIIVKKNRLFNYLDVFDNNVTSNSNNSNNNNNNNNTNQNNGPPLTDVGDILLSFSKYKGPTIYGPDKQTPQEKPYKLNNNTDYSSIFQLKKVNYLDTLCTNFNVSPQKVLFFDDDYTNNITLNKEKVSAITVPGNKQQKINLKTTYKYGFSLTLLQLLNNKINSLDIPVLHDFIFLN
jgi:hypothetical protein